MRKAARSVAVVGALVFLWPAAAMLPALLGSSAACASAAGAGHAALVIDTGSQTLRMCVTLDSASVTGLHLIELAHAQHGLQYRLGFGGLAVCQLAGVGPSGNDCFASYPDFWGLWLGDGSEGWTWSGSGAGSIHVADGDMQAWSWGPGQTGATHPVPPHTTEVSVCGASVPSLAPSPTPPPSAAHTPRATASPSAKPSRTTSPALAPTEAVQPDPSASAAPLAVAGPGGPSGAGLSAGIPLAIGGVLALGFAGWMRTRRGARVREGA